MKDFYYEGYLSASKSLMNRALIVQSFYDWLEIVGQSQCEDVRSLQKALFSFKHGFMESLDCGAGGTTFRFLLARLSRQPGEYGLVGTHRLLQRPHRPLYDLLKGLGVEIKIEEKNCIRLKTSGWQLDKPLKTDLTLSSQYCSALLLSAWKLPQDLVIEIENFSAQATYLTMTIEFLSRLGMVIELRGDLIRVPAGQEIKTEAVCLEPDMSSVFTLACFAATRGSLKIFDFPEKSLQPDFKFIEMFRSMGIPIDIRNGHLFVKSTEKAEPLRISLSGNPDLFPVLSVFLSRVEGESLLSGLDVLAHKESDRLQNTMDLLATLGFSCSYQNKKFRIRGKADHTYPEEFAFNPDEDHRMAMAGALAKHQGAQIDILHREVVDKSFPEFWGATGL